jgi:hypothetical protein
MRKVWQMRFHCLKCHGTQVVMELPFRADLSEKPGKTEFCCHTCQGNEYGVYLELAFRPLDDIEVRIANLRAEAATK